jgi:response regulator NasT
LGFEVVKMNRTSIIVADSGETSRKIISDLLTKRGYKVYQASDGAGAIRIARIARPDLILMDVNLWGINAYEAARIIEEDGLSTVVFITSKPDREFIEKLKAMKFFAYISKPVNTAQLYQIIEFSLANSIKIKSLEEKVEKLESTLASRKKIERAKGILMEKLKLSEEEAYNYLRKKSMDKCISMERIAQAIINGSEV